MRLFELHREVDATGVSGTGTVAEGVEFEDGRVVMRWRTSVTSCALYDSINDVEVIHGHGGATKVVWLEEENRVRVRRPQGRSMYVDRLAQLARERDEALSEVERLKKILITTEEVELHDCGQPGC